MYTKRKRNRKNITKRKNKRKIGGKNTKPTKKINKEVLSNARKLFGSI
jgi:hypothetical protein